MTQDLQDTGQAILREISPWRRFVRSWAFYLLVFATVFSIAISPKEWVWYALIFLAGTNFLALSIVFEEALNKWLNKISVT